MHDHEHDQQSLKPLVVWKTAAANGREQIRFTPLRRGVISINVSCPFQHVTVTCTYKTKATQTKTECGRAEETRQCVYPLQEIRQMIYHVIYACIKKKKKTGVFQTRAAKEIPTVCTVLESPRLRRFFGGKGFTF